MATFVLIPGAASGPGYWYLLEAELRARGHRSIAVDLPNEDDAAGLPEYVDAAIAAIAAAGPGAGELVVVAHSLGGFTGPLVCDRVPVRLLVLLTAMVAKPGEAPGDWWEAVGYEAAARAQAVRDGVSPDEERSEDDVYFHDVPADVAATAFAEARGQSGTPLVDPWPLNAWPDVPTRYVLCTEDRFFPPELVRAVLADRLPDVPVDELPAGHLPMLARPAELADLLVGYVAAN